jgi:16S rRNA (guanine527-N7)-methyltransferase
LILTEFARYESYGLGSATMDRLSQLGDRLLEAGFNVTGIDDPSEIERIHFLDSLSLLSLDYVSSAAKIADIGSGAGFPALVLALVLPSQVVAIESQRKKCDYLEGVAEDLSLTNFTVWCGRVEDYARGVGREHHDLAVSRAVASLPVMAEYSLPLLRIGGRMVAMKGAVSDQELTQAENAAGILGGASVEAIRLQPFEGAVNRWVYVARKVAETHAKYPRKAGIPAKRPLGLRG